MNEPYILITYTTGFGQVPQTTLDFLTNNHHFLLAVASSGNRNWGNNFGKSADIISELYKVPIIHKFELSGTQKDVEIFLREASKIVNNSTGPKMDQIK